MTIYILDQDPAECAKALDDRSLDRMIKSVAQVLQYKVLDLKQGHICCGNIERSLILNEMKDEKVLPITNNLFMWSQWARSCLANYRYLVRLGFALLNEHILRFSNETDPTKPMFTKHKLFKVIAWAYDNEPSLPTRCHNCALCYNETESECDYCQEMTELPLVMPKKYIWDEATRFDKSLYGFRDIDMATRQYRSYYRAKLMRIRSCYEHPCIDSRHGSVGVAFIPCNTCNDVCERVFAAWTRRERPEWLGDL